MAVIVLTEFLRKTPATGTTSGGPLLHQEHVLCGREQMRRVKRALQNVRDRQRSGNKRQVERAARRAHDLRALRVDRSPQGAPQDDRFIGQYDRTTVDAALIDRQTVERTARGRNGRVVAA